MRILGLSLEELGLRALERIPRDRAIDGIKAFVDLRFVPITVYAHRARNSNRFPAARQRWIDEIPQTICGTR